MSNEARQLETLRPPSSRISRLLPSADVTTDACIPIAMVSRFEAGRLGLDASALFVFAFVDDRTPVYEILTRSGMPLPQAAEALAALCETGAIALTT